MICQVLKSYHYYLSVLLFFWTISWCVIDNNMKNENFELAYKYLLLHLLPGFFFSELQRAQKRKKHDSIQNPAYFLITKIHRWLNLKIKITMLSSKIQRRYPNKNKNPQMLFSQSLPSKVTPNGNPSI